MSDPIVQGGQVWLNATYGSNPNYSYVEPNGLHGSAMSAALVSAMQIELGTPVTGVFGDITKEACDRSPLKPGDAGNRVKIMQYGFYNKGYNAGTEDGSFNAFTKAAVREIQEDAGLTDSQITDQVDGLRMGAILGVDEYKLVSGGDVTVRTIQKVLNQRFVAYTDLKACDGHYGRSTNESLIYAIQALEGMSTDMATGFFGPSTKNYLPDLWQPGQWGMNGGYSAAETADFTRIAQYALYCVGIDRYSGSSGSKYNPGTMDGSQNSGTLAALHAFQNDYGLAQRDMIGLNEWMGLLVSTGNPNRDGLACDCATQLTTSALVAALYNDDYRIVGRYLTGTVGGGSSKRAKNLTSSEIQTIFDGGMSLFCIFQDDADWWQDHSDLSGYFGYNRGYADARKAVQAAYFLGIPRGECIYFAIDYDFMEGEVYSKVVLHFQGINAYVSAANSPYRIGIYSARNTCGIVSAQGLASSSFVSDMSTGYSGNLGYPLPSNWAFDQIQEYTNAAGFGIDKNVASGRYNGFNSVSYVPPVVNYERPELPLPGSVNHDMSTVIAQIVEIENLYADYYARYWPNTVLSSTQAAISALDYLRSAKYNDLQWILTLLGPANATFVNEVNATSTKYFFQSLIDGPRTEVADRSTSPQGLVDLAHFAATAQAYLVQNPSIPAFWAGWAGDLASGMADVTVRLGSSEYAGLSAAQVADLTIGAEVGTHASSCNFSDFCSDVDAYMVATKVLETAGTNKHALSDAMSWYYNGPSIARFNHFFSAIDPQANWDNLSEKIKKQMYVTRAADLLTVIDLKGTVGLTWPSEENIQGCCDALSKFIKYTV